MKPAGPTPNTVRRRSRQFQTLHQAARKVQDATGLDDMASAELALEIVVEGIARRLTPGEAADLLAQLPSELRERLPDAVTGPERGLTRETIEAHLVQRLGVEPAHASELVTRIGPVIEELVSPGEIADVRAQLPEDLRAIFSGEVVHHTP